MNQRSEWFVVNVNDDAETVWSGPHKTEMEARKALEAGPLPTTGYLAVREWDVRDER